MIIKNKILVSIAFFLMVVVSAYFIVMEFLLSDLCQNEILSEKPSPGNTYKAVIFHRNCGATTDLSLQLSILDADNGLPDAPGNVFISDGATMINPLIVEWKNSETLEVRVQDTLRVFKKESSWGFPLSNVTVHYLD